MRSCRGGRSVLGGWSGWHRRCCVLIGRSSVRSAIRVAVRSVGGCRGWGRSAIRVCGGHCRSRRRHCRCRSGCRIRISGWRRNSRCVRVGDRCRSAVRGVLCGCGRWHARGWGVAVAGCRIVEACAGWIGLLGHEHNEHDRRGQACDETDDQQEYAGCASRARSATDYGNGAKSRHDEADAQQNATDEVNRVEDDQRGAGLVGVVQAANGKRKGWNNRCQCPNGVDEAFHSIGCIAVDDGAQHREDDGKRDLDDECAQNPPPEFAAGGAALERGVLFPEADERLADGAVVGRLVERSGQCEEAAGPLWLRLRCAVLRLLLVVSGRIAVLRCAVLRRAILGCLLAVVGCAVLRCLLAVIILTVGAVTAILLGLLRVLRIILVGVRH